MKARYIPVGWYQLKFNKLRLLAAVAGILFAVVLMMVQQGLRESLFISAVRWHSSLDFDLAIISPKTISLVRTRTFPRNRVVQAAGYTGVTSITPVYMREAQWKNPKDASVSEAIFVVGFNPADQGFERLLSEEYRERLRLPNKLLFDARSRPEFGPIAEMMAGRDELPVDINGYSMDIVGLFEVSTSFGINGNLLTSDLNFLRLFQNTNASNISLGLIHIEPGADVGKIQKDLQEGLPKDVKILTRAEYIQMEVDYWDKSTAIGFVFAFGVVMGFIVGIIIVYQILFSDVQDHLKEYATLKAMGFTNGYLARVVMQEAMILAVFGFLPGYLLTIQLFKAIEVATNLPLLMTPQLAGNVFLLTLVMCVVSGLIAIRKLKSASPADVF